MSLSCEIKVSNPSDGNFKPGDLIFGVIKYQTYEPCQFAKITVSFKGKGVLDIAGAYKRRFIENYVDIDDVIQQGDVNIEVGTYEAPFSFQVPHNIPPSFECSEICQRYKVNCCRIFYYIRIKFEKPLTLQSGKRFKKDITIGLRITPTLSIRPVKTVKYKNLAHVSNGTGTVYVAGLIESSVIPTGGRIKLLYTIVNETNLMLNGVITKLVEVLTFRPHRPLLKTKCYKTIDGTAERSPVIYARETYNGSITIAIPRHCKGTLENSSLVVRRYFVNVLVELPFPQADFSLKIPVQIGDFETAPTSARIENTIVSPSSSSSSSPDGYVGAPPSYWEIMGDDNYVDVESDTNSASDTNQ